MRRLVQSFCLLFALAFVGCETSTSPDSNAGTAPVPVDGQLDPASGAYTLQTVEGDDGQGKPLRLELVGRNLVVDAAASTVSIEVAIRNNSDLTLHPAVVVWLADFVPPSVMPLNADVLPPTMAAGPMPGPWGYRYDERLGDDAQLAPGETSDFVSWVFYDPDLTAFRFRARIDFSLQEGAARLGGRIFEDSNLDGLPSLGETGFGAGVVMVTGPSDLTMVAEVNNDGAYVVRVDEPGLYSLLYLPPPTLNFAPLFFTTPNPLQVLLPPGADGQIDDYLAAHFGIAPGGALIRPIEFSEQDPDEIPTDPFALLDAGVRAQLLFARVGFSGCGPAHPFHLFMSGDFLLDPAGVPTAELALTHDGKGELCEAYFEQERGFDLQPLIARYREQHGRVDRIRLLLTADGETRELWLEPLDPNAY